MSSIFLDKSSTLPISDNRFDKGPFFEFYHKEDNFIGKEALLERKANPQRKLVGLEIEGNETTGHGDCVHPSNNGREQVGIITSGMKSPVLNKNIALCKINVKYSELNTEVEIGKLDGQQKRIRLRLYLSHFMIQLNQELNPNLFIF